MKMTRRGMVMMLAIGVTAWGCAGEEATTEPADLVLQGGRIATVDETRPEAEALAVRGDSIVAVGSMAEIEPFVGDDTRVLDLAGGLVIPGFIEGHGHFLGLGYSRLILDLTVTESWEEIVAMVEEAVSAAEPGQWITGRGWHQDKWVSVPDGAVGGVPTHASLSAVAPDNPVVLRHASGHGSIANAKAMAVSGLGSDTPDPDGGTIVRDSRGEPTGYLRETAQGLVTSPELTEADLRRAIELASDECLTKGVTSFQDAGTSVEDVGLLRAIAAEGGLGMRLWVMVRDDDEALLAALPGIKVEGEGNGHLTVGGIKHSIDGALGSHGAWLLAPYEDMPESTGLNTTTPETISASAQIAIDHGLQLCVHAIGDRANRETIDLFEGVAAERGSDLSALRWRVEHAQHLDPEDIPRFAELGVIASMQGVHCTSDGPWVPARLGTERAEAGAYMWRTLLDSGAVVSNGTDVPVEDVDPIANFHSTVTRRMGNGETFYPDERMTREEALRSMTLSAAYAAFEEEIKGSLTPGKLADITVLSKDILTVPEEEILQTQVLYTIVGGEVRYERR